MTDERKFVFRIAFFNALGTVTAMGGVTYLDARLTSHVVYGAREYPLGYWICLASPVVFILTWVSLAKLKGRYVRIIAPGAILMGTGLLSLPNFRPEVPHFGVIFWMTLYAATGVVTAWIRLEPLIEQDSINDMTIPWEFRVERLKESIILWRTIAVGVTFGYLALIVPFSVGLWNSSDRIVTRTDEAFLLSTGSALGLTIFTVYVLVGAIYESFRKAKLTADLLLAMRK